MTTAFAALLIGVAGAALLLALGAYWWVNRTPPEEERFDPYGRVPLFGADIAGTGAKATTPRHVDAIQEEVAAPVSRASRDYVDAIDADIAPPVGNPISIESAVVESAEVASKAPEASNGNHASFAPPPPPPPQVSHPPRSSWGSTPGWPSNTNNGLPATPKFVAPVVPEVAQPAAPIAAPASASNGNGVSADGVAGSMVEGHRIRFSTPVEGTLQFLPGRLEISTGLDTGREIRFVRVPGPNGTEVTFGRNEGPLYRHIQLRDQTVSREHARMVFAEGHWTLTNLSRTNPVAHNGRILRLAEEQQLGDGDRLEMGEVIFSFRSR